MHPLGTDRHEFTTVELRPKGELIQIQKSQPAGHHEINVFGFMSHNLHVTAPTTLSSLPMPSLSEHEVRPFMSCSQLRSRSDANEQPALI